MITNGDDFDMLRQVIMNPRVNKKSFSQFTASLPVRVKQLKQNIMALKKKILVAKQGGDMEIKTTIFDIPVEVWRCSGFDSFFFESKFHRTQNNIG